MPSLKLIPVRGANGGVFVRRLQGHGSNLARRGSIYDVRKSASTERMKQPVRPDQPRIKLNRGAVGTYLAGASGYAAGAIARGEANAALSRGGGMSRNAALRALKWSGPMKLAGIGAMGAGLGLQARSANKQRRKSVSKSIFTRDEVSKKIIASEERDRAGYNKMNARRFPNPTAKQQRILNEGFQHYRNISPTYGDVAAMAGGLGSGGYLMHAGNKIARSPLRKPSKGLTRNMKIAAAVAVPSTIWNARGTVKDAKNWRKIDDTHNRATAVELAPKVRALSRQADQLQGKR